MNKLAIKEIEKLVLENKEELGLELLHMLEKDERAGVKKLVERYKKHQVKQKEQKVLFERMSEFERQLKDKGVNYIAGIDEVGRGPLAGPVVACAVILPEDFYLPGLTDSKKLPRSKRKEFYEIITREAIAVNVSFVSSTEIDQLNIYQATKKAMTSAISGLAVLPEHLLIDAMKLEIEIPQTSIVKGDQRSISIAASSIVAKETRDRYMEDLSLKFPNYHFEQHMGYGTKEHLLALKTFGVIEEHRLSFSPIKEAIALHR